MTEKKARTGAAKLSVLGLVQLQVPLPPADRDMVRAAAALSGLSVRQWAAALLTEAARKILADYSPKKKSEKPA